METLTFESTVAYLLNLMQTCSHEKVHHRALKSSIPNDSNSSEAANEFALAKRDVCGLQRFQVDEYLLLEKLTFFHSQITSLMIPTMLKL
jgi:hypothetical protein